MKNFIKKALSIFIGLLWVVMFPVGIFASFLTCLFTDATLLWCAKFWVLCAIALLSGKGFDEYDDSEGNYDDWISND